MHHIFVEESQLTDYGKTLRITGDDFHHIVRVLRMKAGEELSVSLKNEVSEKGVCADLSVKQAGNIREGEERAEYRFGIDKITEDEVVCTLRFVKRDTAELPVRLILLQGLPKGDKMEQIIEKNTELGIAEIVPVSLKRCVVKLEEKKAASRVARWNKIAESAAKQARRGIIPQVTKVMTLTEALAYVGDADGMLLPYELEPVAEECIQADPTKDAETLHTGSAQGMARTRELIEGVTPGQTVVIFIGPEGGFDEQEVEKAREAGFETITLGGRILRTETAGMTVTAWMGYRFS